MTTSSGGPTERDPAALLPTRALTGKRIGISVSDSADLARLGLTEAHFQLALRELARTALIEGATLAYGGHLLPGGYTHFLVGELGQYARIADLARRTSDVPLLICLSNQEHRHCSRGDLEKIDANLGVYGELRCIDLEGRVVTDPMSGRDEAGEPYPTDRGVLAQGLTALRRYMTANTAGRMLLGGKRHGYTGSMPGVLEEALMALEVGQPLYLASGFGGSALDVAGAVDPQLDKFCPRHAGDPPLDAATHAGLVQVRAVVGKSGWSRLNNGLTPQENLRLSVTHRPGEIAALVALGIGRIAQGLS